MYALVFIILAFLFLGMFLVGNGLNVLIKPTPFGTSGSMRLFGGLAMVFGGVGVVYGWIELVMWLVEHLK